MLVPTFVTPGKILDYEAWKVHISMDGNSAVARRKLNGGVTEVALRRSSLSIPLEGWYGDEPSSAEFAIGGACILCECFGLHLVGEWQRTTAPPFLSPCNHHDSLSIERFVQEEGHVIVAADLPMELCQYHTILVQVQAEVAKQKQVKMMLYHIPRKEYHHSHGIIERLAGIALPGFHRHLDWYTDVLECFVRETFKRAGVGVRIIDPFFPGMDPNDAYRYPYLNLRSLGLNPQSLIAIEDLVEVRIAVETRTEIPVWTGVLGFPSPYRQRGVARTKRFPLDCLAH